ncbi:MAG: acetate--CoA ligase [Fibrobacterota bacterium]|nr:acetate--CoA ligase [Fibrobacterota bacterium]QQS05534.1 MAG: acetate--CoA ligase [Fibrobacterota bacterium]
MSDSNDFRPAHTYGPGASLPTADHAHQMRREALDDVDGFWSKAARERIDWMADFHTVQDCDFREGRVAWFLGGKLNVSENCLDRHLATRADKTAILWEGDEPGEVRKLTYRELHAETCRMANAMRRLGVRKGDRIAIYMPMIPEAAVAMLACARVGAVHSVVFAGFSAESLRDRIQDAQCSVVFTADEGMRGGKRIPLKKTVDEAVSQCPSVKHVVVAERTGAQVPWHEGRDLRWGELAQAERPYAPSEPMDSEDLLFLLYTSGSTGKPKGVAHATGGYLVHAALSHQLVFDLREDDVYACVADIGWITGHSYVVYGPLANGATTVMFESIPTYPDPSRYWDLVERHKVTIFYTAPTAIRAVMREGDQWLDRHDRSSLRVLGSVGEPINPEAWRWYHDKVGAGKCPIVDTWWQTETGGILISPLAGASDLKPGSATLPVPGIRPVVLDEKGEEVEGNGVSGLLALKGSWPAQARTIWGDHKRFCETYFKPFPGYYFTGDGCRRDEDGFWWITGRVDDVINVSGHRMGTAEVESALVSHEACAEAAVVGFPHEIKGQGIFAWVILKEGWKVSPEIVGELKNECRHHIGPIAVPDRIVVVPGLPKTRSGKIMRRILRKVAAGETDQLGDITTLADPSIVQALISAAGKS